VCVGFARLRSVSGPLWFGDARAVRFRGFGLDLKTAGRRWSSGCIRGMSVIVTIERLRDTQGTLKKGAAIGREWKHDYFVGWRESRNPIRNGKEAKLGQSGVV